LLLCLKIKPDIIYCRNYIVPIFTSLFGINTVMESHAHVGHSSIRFNVSMMLLRHLRKFLGIVTIAEPLKSNFMKLGFRRNKILVLPDSVDTEIFIKPQSFSKSKRTCPIVLYSGHLYDYKGIPTILEAAKLCPDYQFQLLGGFDHDICRIKRHIIKEELINVSLLGRVSHSQVPKYLWDADVLLLPPSSYHPSSEWTSPVKLGEYLASGTPTVATSINALLYWLRNDEVVFVPPDSPTSLVDGIRSILENDIDTTSMISNALALASQLTYKNRCRAIINHYFHKDR